MAKYWQALAVCVPRKFVVNHPEEVLAKIMAMLCEKLDVKSGGLVPMGSYTEAKAHFGHYLIFAEQLPPMSQLERWSMEVLKRHES